MTAPPPLGSVMQPATSGGHEPPDIEGGACRARSGGDHRGDDREGAGRSCVSGRRAESQRRLICGPGRGCVGIRGGDRPRIGPVEPALHLAKPALKVIEPPLHGLETIGFCGPYPAERQRASGWHAVGLVGARRQPPAEGVMRALEWEPWPPWVPEAARARRATGGRVAQAARAAGRSDCGPRHWCRRWRWRGRWRRGTARAPQDFQELVELPFHGLDPIVGRTWALPDLPAALRHRGHSRRHECQRDQSQGDPFELREQHGFQHSLGEGGNRGRDDPGRGRTGRGERRDPDRGLRERGGHDHRVGLAGEERGQGRGRQGHSPAGETILQPCLGAGQAAREGPLGHAEAPAASRRESPSSSQRMTAERYRSGRRASSSSTMTRSSLVSA